MSTQPDYWITDENSIDHVAATPEERRQALNSCLLVWSTVDIAAIERIDSDGPEWHGWTMRIIKPPAVSEGT